MSDDKINSDGPTLVDNIVQFQQKADDTEEVKWDLTWVMTKMKEHDLHTMLVIGYDEDDRLVLIGNVLDIDKEISMVTQTQYRLLGGE